MGCKVCKSFFFSFFKCACYFLFLLEEADGKIYALHLKLNVLTFNVDLRDFRCLDCLRLRFKEILAQTSFASSEKVLLHSESRPVVSDWDVKLDLPFSLKSIQSKHHKWSQYAQDCISHLTEMLLMKILSPLSVDVLHPSNVISIVADISVKAADFLAPGTSAISWRQAGISIVEIFLSLTVVILFCHMCLSKQAEGLIFICEKIYYLQYCIEAVIFFDHSWSECFSSYF